MRRDSARVVPGIGAVQAELGKPWHAAAPEASCYIGSQSLVEDFAAIPYWILSLGPIQESASFPVLPALLNSVIIGQVSVWLLEPTGVSTKAANSKMAPALASDPNCY